MKCSLIGLFGNYVDCMERYKIRHASAKKQCVSSYPSYEINSWYKDSPYIDFLHNRRKNVDIAKIETDTGTKIINDEIKGYPRNIGSDKYAIRLIDVKNKYNGTILQNVIVLWVFHHANNYYCIKASSNNAFCEKNSIYDEHIYTL